MRHVKSVLDDHHDTICLTVAIMGHFRGAAEVCAEHDLAEEAAERGERYAQENMIDLRTKMATAPTSIDRLRERLENVE